MNKFQNLFYPKSVAIVGASTKEGSVGNDVVKNLINDGFAGSIYPINPKVEELNGLKCFPNLTAINAPIDLMVIVVPASVVPAVLEEGAGLGIKAAIIISAGFKEVGNVELENQVRDICQKNDIVLIGPNCLGVINADAKLNASFAPIMPVAGSVAFISQSGALCTAVLDYAANLKIGFSKFMSIGNKAVVDELAILNYLAEDPQTKVIAMYVEQLVNAPKLRETLYKITHGQNPKPVIILKSGRTSAGAGASASHTGALAGNDVAYEALFYQSGVVRALSVAELFDYIQIFLDNPLASTKNVAVITNAGGPGVLTTDEIILNNLQLAKLDQSTVDSLKNVMPAAANCYNPIDVLGDAKADRYQAALEAALNDKNVDAAVVILTPQSMTEVELTAEAAYQAKVKYNKPLAVSFMGGDIVKPGVAKLRSEGVAAFPFPEQAVKALKTLNSFFDNSREAQSELFVYSDIDREKVKNIFAAAKQAGKTSFPEFEAIEILSAYNFPLLKSRVVKNAIEAEAYAKEIGVPVVMKIVSQDILHKSDVGGIALNVTEMTAASEYEAMIARVSKNKPEAKLDGVLLVEMAGKGTELILGSMKDPSLGNMAMVGMGGIYVEILKDVAFGLAPLTKTDAEKMIKGLKSYQILDGARGQIKADVPALLECLGRLSQLLFDFPEIKELDINPLLVLAEGQGVKVLDARIVIE